MEQLEGAGYEAFLVGGCVRDSLLGREPGDFDICTVATPQEMKECLGGFSLAETGLRHGTLTVINGHEPFEVTTFRTEGAYSDRRRPDSVEFSRRLEDDLKRRDFTVNAMAYSDKRGLVDLYGGAEDLKKGVLRCVGEPTRRFSEDALRIMRCVRFAAQLDFEVEAETDAAVHSLKNLLDEIAIERIRIEFVKMLCGRAAAGALRAYRDVVAQFIPEIRDSFECDQQNDYHIYDVWEHTLHAVDAIRPQPLLRLTAFFHDIAKPACKTVTEENWGHFYHHESRGAQMTRDIMTRMKFDKATRDTVCELVKRHGIVFNAEGRQPRRLLVKMGEEKLRMLIEMEKADVKSQAPFCIDERLQLIASFEAALDRVLSEENCFSIKDLAVDGRDVMDAGVPQGRRVGQILQQLFDDVVEERLKNERSQLLKAIHEMAGS